MTSTEIPETRKSVSFSGQTEVEISQTFEQNDELFSGAVAPSEILWLVSPMSSFNMKSKSSLKRCHKAVQK